MLKLTDAHAYYGHVHALRGITLEIRKGQIVALLGANGAGKSTTLKMISRLIELKRGNYEFEGRSMLKASESDVVKAGIIHCPEGRRVFPLLTVEENLKIGAYQRKDHHQVKRDMERMLDAFPKLKARLMQNAGTLSGGEQQILAIARSLMGKPDILLLDEPSLGVAPIIVQEIFRIIRSINQEGVSILLVEQNARMALEISDYAYVLENGSVAMEGKAADLKDNDDIRRLYLGG